MHSTDELYGKRLAKRQGGCYIVLAETSMSKPRLPEELLDHIVDFLHDEEYALKNCSLVSKPWISRARKHLFASIKFRPEKNLGLWKETFPDPSTSPACYARTLIIGCSHLITAADVEAGGWIRGFSQVVHLEVGGERLDTRESTVPLLALRGLSPFVKSLRVDFVVLPYPPALDLILSFPLLEDLAIEAYGKSIDDADYPYGFPTVVHPSTPPPFTGYLDLFLRGGMEYIVYRLLSFPGAVRFRKLTLKWCHGEDISLTVRMVEECSLTLESLDITCDVTGTPGRYIRVCADSLLQFPGGPEWPWVDLSKATRLREVVFRPRSRTVKWITTALQSAVSNPHLRETEIHVPYFLTFLDVGVDVRLAIGEGLFRQWLDLDRFLVQSWGSRSIPPKVIHTTRRGVSDVRDYIGCLLPEVTRRGIVDSVELREAGAM